jgi:hypothetical protein
MRDGRERGGEGQVPAADRIAIVKARRENAAAAARLELAKQCPVPDPPRARGDRLGDGPVVTEVEVGEAASVFGYADMGHVGDLAGAHDEREAK